MNHGIALRLLLAAAIGLWTARVGAAAGGVSVELPADTARLVQEGKGTVELDVLSDQINFLVDGKSVSGTIEDTVNEYHSGRAGWPVKDETGVLMTLGPEGPALRFTTSYVACNAVSGVGAGRQWTLAFWIRPDHPDWGTTFLKTTLVPPAVMRPTIVSLGGQKDYLWAVRLCRMCLELDLAGWKARGTTRLPVGRWTHVAIVRDGEQVHVYLDGKPETLAPALQPDGTPSKQSALGPLTVAASPAVAGQTPEAVRFLRLACHPGKAKYPPSDTRVPDMAEKFIGAMGSFSLENRAWSDTEVSTRAAAGRDEADRLSIRCSVLDDPAVGHRARYPQPQYRFGETSEAFLERTAWWHEAKYGLFMHWGPSTLTGKEISWSRGTGPGLTPPEVYDNLYKRFNPTKYDPTVWARQINTAGMKYAVLVIKHHDGFCEWPTKTNQYNIAYTPHREDIFGPYVAAMRQGGVRVGLYFSWPDWWCEERMKKEKGPTGWYAPLKNYCLAQEREICTNYGPLDLFWFDAGGGIVFDGIEKVQPRMMVNDRGTPSDYATAENFPLDHPMLNPNGSDSYWELCCGSGGAWGYSSDQPGFTRATLIGLMVQVVAKGGNWLLNVSPRPDGHLPEAHMTLFAEVGKWLKVNGKGIYGTHRTHLGWQPFGWTTAGKATLYLHVLKWPGTTLTLNDVYDEVTDVSLLTDMQKLSFKQERDTLTVNLPPAAPDSIDTVIAVRVRHAPGVTVMKGQFVNRAVGGEAKASVEYAPEQTAPKAFDDNPGTKWFTATSPTAWLQYRFAKGAAWAITRYALTSAGDVPERDPKDWEFQGSNDGTTWKTLDTRRDQSFSSRLVTRVFSCPNTTAYTHYRLNVTANHGAGGLQLADVELLSYEIADLRR